MKVNSLDTNYIGCNFVLAYLVYFIHFAKKYSKLIGTENYEWLASIYKCG